MLPQTNWSVIENALRDKVLESPRVTLLTGCTVTARPVEDPPTVEYSDPQNNLCRVTSQWLVGADGKVGIVRKHFLEPTAGVRQEEGIYRYDGTWMAANLKISLPTLQTHPKFPLWALGYTPQNVYDLFWPEGWHFCSPPGKATAAGRFGPHDERLWRHEFRQETTVDPEEYETLLWEHVTPMITLERDQIRGREFGMLVQYPRDCIEVLRCRPFRFTHKVVNRWFDNKTVLIGDAAHVFPPFAGQGIASGLRDAHQLAWRLSLLIQNNASEKLDLPSADVLLGSWARERRYSVDDAALFSRLVGQLCNNQAPAWLKLCLKAKALLDNSAWLSQMLDPMVQKYRKGFAEVPNGFFAMEHRGGTRLPQIFLQSSATNEILLSDRILGSSSSAFTLLGIVSKGDDIHVRYREIRKAINEAMLPNSVLTEKSIIMYRPANMALDNLDSESIRPSIDLYTPHILDRLSPEYVRCGGYNADAYTTRLGRSTKFAIIRADAFVFACADSYAELVQCLAILRQRLVIKQVPSEKQQE